MIKRLNHKIFIIGPNEIKHNSKKVRTYVKYFLNILIKQRVFLFNMKNKK